MITIKARDVKPGDVLQEFGEVDEVEVSDDNVMISRTANGDGNWGDFDPDEDVVIIKELPHA